jgi:hypothetical protein
LKLIFPDVVEFDPFSFEFSILSINFDFISLAILKKNSSTPRFVLALASINGI